MRPPLGTVEKYTFKSTGMHMFKGGRTGSEDPRLNVPLHSNPASSGPSISGTGSHHGGNQGGMGMGMNMRTAIEKTLRKRQMHMMDMKDAAWTHAMHVHLVDMKLISRRKDDPSKSEGREYLEGYEQDSIKDVVLLGSNEIIEVLVKYQPYPGVYVSLPRALCLFCAYFYRCSTVTTAFMVIKE